MAEKVGKVTRWLLERMLAKNNPLDPDRLVELASYAQAPPLSETCRSVVLLEGNYGVDRVGLQRRPVISNIVEDPDHPGKPLFFTVINGRVCLIDGSGGATEYPHVSSAMTYVVSAEILGFIGEESSPAVRFSWDNIDPDDAPAPPPDCLYVGGRPVRMSNGARIGGYELDPQRTIVDFRPDDLAIAGAWVLADTLYFTVYNIRGGDDRGRALRCVSVSGVSHKVIDLTERVEYLFVPRSGADPLLVIDRHEDPVVGRRSALVRTLAGHCAGRLGRLDVLDVETVSDPDVTHVVGTTETGLLRLQRYDSDVWDSDAPMDPEVISQDHFSQHGFYVRGIGRYSGKIGYVVNTNSEDQMWIVGREKQVPFKTVSALMSGSGGLMYWGYVGNHLYEMMVTG